MLTYSFKYKYNLSKASLAIVPKTNYQQTIYQKKMNKWGFYG